MEEIDLCWRFKRLGKKVMYQPSSKVYHVGGGTLSYASSRKTFLNFRNSLLMILKNEAGNTFSVIFQRLVLDAIAAFSFLIKGQVGSFFAVFRSHLAFYSLFFKFKKKRKQLAIANIGAKSNTSGRSQKSIVVQHYLKGVKKFTEL